MRYIKQYDNWLTKKYQRKKSYDEYLYDNGFGDRYYICTKCDSNKLTPIMQGGMTPPTWHCDNCDEMNYAPKWLSPKEYKEYIENKKIKKTSSKYNL